MVLIMVEIKDLFGVPSSRSTLTFQGCAAKDASKDSDPSFDVVTNDLQIYIPVLEKSTIVFDLQTSDALVKKKGETDYNTLLNEIKDPSLAKSQQQINSNGSVQFLFKPFQSFST